MDLEIHRESRLVEIEDLRAWQGKDLVLVDNDTRIRVWGSGQGAVFYSYLLVGFWLLVGCWLLSSSWLLPLLLWLLLLQVLQIASCIKQCSSFIIDASCIFDVSQMMLRLVLNTIVACTQITFKIPCTAKVRMHEYKHANTHVVGFKSNSTKWHLHDHLQYFLFQHRNGSSPPFQWVMHFQMMDSSCPF